MKRNASSLGAFHPALFLTFVFSSSLLLASFVCYTVLGSLHGQDGMAEKKVVIQNNIAPVIAMQPAVGW